MAIISIELDDSVGAAYVGLLAAAILFGITNLQAFMYYQSYPEDPKFLKIFIGILWVLDAFHLICIAHYLYFITITNFGNFLIILKPVWSLCTELLIAAIADLFVRLYYVWRVWILSRGNWFLTGGAAIFTIATLVSGVAFAVIGYRSKILLEVFDVQWLVYVGLGSAMVTDIWVASSLCFLLSRNRTGLERSNSMINTVMMYTIGTGLLTSICALCSFVTFAALPGSYIFIVFHFALSKLYFNALLAMLNSRNRMRDRTPSGRQRSGSRVEAFRLPKVRGTSFQDISLGGKPTRTESTDILAPTAPDDMNSRVGRSTSAEWSRTDTKQGSVV